LAPGSPKPALDAGADVVVQSCHKTLGSLVGTALLHIGKHSLVEPARLRETLNLLQSTSPNYLLLASLDAVRRHMWRHGRVIFAEAARQGHELAADLARMPGISVLETGDDPRLAEYRRDPLRVVVNVARTGWTGYEVERFLRTEQHVEDEFADFFNVVLVLSPHDDAEARARLLEGFRAVSSHPRPINKAAAFTASHLLQPPIPPLIFSPREAVLGRTQTVSLAASIGRASAETITFYPPGIPLVMPGEQMTPETIHVCQELLAAGAHCYASDTTLTTIKAVDASITAA
jgi:lysine decarboxylase